MSDDGKEQAPGTDAGASAGAGENNAGKTDGKADKVTFTAEQQKHIDDVILARVHAKYKAAEEKKLAELTEAKRLEGMSNDERIKAENEALKKQVAEYNHDKLVNQFKLELTQKGLPADFADRVQIDTAENANGFVKELASYKTTVEKPLLEKIAKLEEELRNANLRGQAPKQPVNAADKVDIAKRKFI